MVVAFNLDALDYLLTPIDSAVISATAVDQVLASADDQTQEDRVKIRVLRKRLKNNYVDGCRILQFT
jgi:PleD family two-component response regulator